MRDEVAAYSERQAERSFLRVLGERGDAIVPVSGQQRGRLFLPFADDDPRTAEVLAKVLMLARDREIKDPSILEQLRS